MQTQNPSKRYWGPKGTTRYLPIPVPQMKREFTLEYWQDDGWYVGKLKEIPGVFSQGETVAELEENIADAYRMMSEETRVLDHPPAETKGILLEVA